MKPLRIFVYEYACAGGAGEEALAESLRAEGLAMLAAALDDWRRLPQVETATLWDGRYQPTVRASAVHGSRPGEEEAAFRALARSADYSLIIAPECADILSVRSAWVEEAGGRLLGCTPAAVRLAGDKLELARHLRTHGVRTPPCVAFVPGGDVPIDFPAVWKPRDGAGSTATFLVHTRDQCEPLAERARAEGWQGEAMVQSYMPGRPASVAVLVGPRQQLALAPAEQHLSTDGRFRYLGGSVPISGRAAERAQQLAREAVAAVPGLRGYVGVDLVLGAAKDGREDWVIEINPRLTTSYVGLRALADTNLMATMLEIVEGRETSVAWREGVVEFRADGTVQRHPRPSGTASHQRG